MQAGTEAEIDEIGFFVPEMRPAQGMARGRGRLRDHRDQGRRPAAGRRHADLQEEPAAEPLPGYREVKPVVFCGLFPIDTDRYEDLRDALDRLALNDAALSLRARDLAGAGVRLSLRLPRPAAHGHRPRAAGARVRPRAAGDDAQRPLRGRAARRRAARGPQPGRDARPGRDRARSASPTSAPRSSPRPATSAR